MNLWVELTPPKMELGSKTIRAFKCITLKLASNSQHCVDNVPVGDKEKAQ